MIKLKEKGLIFSLSPRSHVLAVQFQDLQWVNKFIA